MPKGYTTPIEPGELFGQLQVVKEAERTTDGYGFRQLLCLCLACGSEKVIRLATLRRGPRGSKTCGCSNVTHGMSREGLPEYVAWNHMHQRCSNPNNPRYHRYGGRGIKVCERWNDFAAFISDIGRRPTDKHSIDRFPNYDGDYEPGNVRWATAEEQSRNKESAWRVTFNGETRLVIELSEEYGIKYVTLQHRLLRGWTIERALNTPVPKDGRNNQYPESQLKVGQVFDLFGE